MIQLRRIRRTTIGIIMVIEILVRRQISMMIRRSTISSMTAARIMFRTIMLVIMRVRLGK